MRANHTDWVVFQHAHHGGGSGALEGVKETRHGHGDEPHVYQTSLSCWTQIGSADSALVTDRRSGANLPFLAMVGDAVLKLGQRLESRDGTCAVAWKFPAVRLSGIRGNVAPEWLSKGASSQLAARLVWLDWPMGREVVSGHTAALSR